VIFCPKVGVGFDRHKIFWNAVHRTNLNALRAFKVADAFRTPGGIDLVVIGAFKYGVLGAFRFAHVPLDALVGDQQRPRISRVGRHGDLLRITFADTFGQCLFHDRVHELGDITAKGGNFPD